MIERQTRRQFLKTAIASASALTAGRFFAAPNILADSVTRSKLRLAVIGCGVRGTGSHVPVAVGERLVALVDADENNIAKAIKKGKLDSSRVRAFTDYRKMFEVMRKDLDAVIIATPNHHHTLPALMAMELGIHVYVEKPMAYDIAEARRMAEFAKRFKVATQMGNQGHSGEGYRRLCEYIWAGAIGDVTEVHTWSNRANGGIGPRPPVMPVPEGMNWDSWIGPAPYRDYHADLHPHEWHGWHDFGNGSLGNTGCHILDGAFWALKLGHPASIEVEEMIGGTDERYPLGTRVRWDFPARDKMPPVKVYWFDGKRGSATKTGHDENDTADSVAKTGSNRPPLVVELERQYNRNFGGNGALYVGTKGYMVSGFYGEGVRIVPESAHQAYAAPPKTIPRIVGSHQEDFFRACRDLSRPACADFEYSARLTEMTLLGCIAIKAGVHKKIEWDGPNMRCTNMPGFERGIQRPYRTGWKI